MTIVLKPTFGQKLSAALAETRLRLVNVSRYPGQLAMEIIIPIVFASMPMLLGRADRRLRPTRSAGRLSWCRGS